MAPSLHATQVFVLGRKQQIAAIKAELKSGTYSADDRKVLKARIASFQRQVTKAEANLKEAA